MKIVVVGGTGRVGARLVALLTRDGHEVVAASRRSGIDVTTGQGLCRALSGAAVVVDVANAPSFEAAAAMTFFTTSTRTLLAAEAEAGVRHHVMLSVVGAGDLPDGGYFRAKRAQEQLIATAAIPYSIVRATQFFEFMDAIADAATHGGVVRVPSVHIQPIAADDVARTLATIATGPPLNGTIELGGPEPFYLDALVQRVLGARHDPRAVVADPHAPYFGAAVGARSLVAGDDAELGEIRFEQWLDGAAPTRETHEFRLSDLPPGSVMLLGDVAVFSVEGGFCATQARCTHRQGPLSEGTLDGSTVTCPLHGACFNVWTGAVLRGPATQPLETYPVAIEGDVGRVEVPLADAVRRVSRG
jgi:uncharacterized protein YbjT (DUF2867 family)/nitrite reductase/ring-hydroxylating ferredoxin subunit